MKALTLDQAKDMCPAAFQTEPDQDRSASYVHISTEPVVHAMQEAGFSISRAAQTNSRDENRRGYARHLIAFRPTESFEKPVVGGAVPEILLLNSHDGKCAYRLHVGLYRFVCANGMIAGHNFESVSIRHRGFQASQVVEESEKIFEHYVPRLKTWVQKAEDVRLTRRQQINFARKAQAIRYEGEPFPPDELLTVRRHEDNGDSVWSTYNRVQENLMRGGIEFKNANGRRCKTKPINRVTKDVIFNQKLWDVATDYLEKVA